MRKRLVAAAITLILILSSIAPVYAGPIGGGTGPPDLRPPQGRVVVLPICISPANAGPGDGTDPPIIRPPQG